MNVKMTAGGARAALPAFVIVAMIIAVGAGEPAYAAFKGTTWISGTQYYKCVSSLSSIDNDVIDPCPDFQKAADLWNKVDQSAWSLTGSTSGINIGAEDLEPMRTIARASTFGWPFHITAWINFNTDHAFGNGPTPAGSFDYKTVALHEIGHLLRLNHRPDTSSIMHQSLSPNTVKFQLANPEIAAIQEMY